MEDKSDEAESPVTIQELVQLADLGISPKQITWSRVTLTSDQHICLRQTATSDNTCKDQIQVLELQTTDESAPLLFPYPADSALVSPQGPDQQDNNGCKLALKAADLFIVLRLDSSHTQLASCSLANVLHWAWLSASIIGLVTQTDVYHWDVTQDTTPSKVFPVHPRLDNAQIISYKADPDLRWFALTGLSAQDDSIGGITQLFSVDKDAIQCIEAHTVTLVKYQREGSNSISTLLCTACRDNYNPSYGKVHIVDLGCGSDGIVVPSSGHDVLEFVDGTNHYDFPVSLQVCNKYGVLYMMTKYGRMYLIDMETTSCLCSFLVSPDVIFTTALNTATQGVLAVNRSGQVLAVDLKIDVLVQYLRENLKKPLLAERLEKALPLIPPQDLM